MGTKTPGQTPEGRLIEEAAKASGRSIRSLAANAGISDTRWRHLVRGWQPGHDGEPVPAVAKPLTLARIASVLGITGDQLTKAGRDDAADLIHVVGKGLTGLIPPAPDITFPAKGGLMVGSFALGTSVKPHPDEIDMIYASKMPAKEKLLRIRQVLQLRAQVEAEEAAQYAAETQEAPADMAGASDENLPESQQS